MARTYFAQVAAWGRSRGAVATLRRKAGTVVLVFEGNSSFLNDLTPHIGNAALRIAADVDALSPVLVSWAQTIRAELDDQLVDWSDVPTVTVGRPNREHSVRLDGAAGAARIGAEIEVHVDRVRRALRRHHSASGPTAWRRRDASELILEIDARSLVGAARRASRLIDETSRTRLPGVHMTRVAERFNEQSEGLTTVRNIFEHLDAYEVGKGKLDQVGAEPGHAIALQVDPDDVVLLARSASVRLLAMAQAAQAALNCTSAALGFHFRWRAAADLFGGFDFVETDQASAERWIVRRDAETAEQRQHRDMFAKFRPEFTIPDTPCPHCGLAM